MPSILPGTPERCGSPWRRGEATYGIRATGSGVGRRCEQFSQIHCAPALQERPGRAGDAQTGRPAGPVSEGSQCIFSVEQQLRAGLQHTLSPRSAAPARAGVRMVPCPSPAGSSSVAPAVPGFRGILRRCLPEWVRRKQVLIKRMTSYPSRARQIHNCLIHLGADRADRNRSQPTFCRPATPQPRGKRRLLPGECCYRRSSGPLLQHMP